MGGEEGEGRREEGEEGGERMEKVLKEDYLKINSVCVRDIHRLHLLHLLPGRYFHGF